MNNLLKKWWFVFSDISWLMGVFYLLYLKDTGTHYPSMVGGFVLMVMIWGFITWISTLIVVCNKLFDS